MKLTINLLVLLGFVVGTAVCGDDEKIKLGNRIVKNLSVPAPQQPLKRRQSRILGGTYVTEKDQAFFKHQVLSVCTDSNHKGASISCGASLIAKDWVITAAHCLNDVHDDPKGSFVYKAESCNLYFGITNLLQRDKSLKRSATTNDFIVHKDWNPESLLSLHDIALIKLNTPVDPSNNIAPISLPTKKEGCLSNEGKTVTVSGWGMTDDNELKANNVLKTVDVEVAKVADCRKTWGGGLNPNSMICASAKNYVGTCEGDSGGPMVGKRENGEQVLIGVTSFGMPTCVTDDHRIFTCTYAYRSWIEEKTGMKL